MRILYITHEAKMGGASKSLLTLAKHMVSLGHEVTILGPFGSGEMKNEIEKCGDIRYISAFFTWWQYPTKAGMLLKIFYILGYFYNVPGKAFLYRKFRNEEYDIVHSNSSVINVGCYVSSLVKAKHIWHFREFGEPDLGIKYVLGKKKSMKYVNAHVDKVIYISRAIQDYYSKWVDVQKGVIIYNGVGKEYLNMKTRSDYCRNGRINFLISGAMQEGKGQDCVIEAVHLLKKRGKSNFRVIIAGRDMNNYKQKLKNKISQYKLENEIEIVGYIKDMLALRKNTDVELVCSYREAFGRVTVEAMMASNLVIASNSGANPELIKEGYNGFLFECNDANGLADCMERLIDEKSMIFEMGKHSYEYARDHYSSEQNANLIEQLYKKIATEG